MHWYKLCILEARYPAVESFSGRYSIRRGSLEIPTNTECDNLHVFCMYTIFCFIVTENSNQSHDKNGYKCDTMTTLLILPYGFADTSFILDSYELALSI